MSIEALSWALMVPVGGNQKVVLIGLANHANPFGEGAYPSYETLARYACCDRSTAKRNVLRLEEAGWIERDGLGPRGENRWRLNMGGGGDRPRGEVPPRGAGVREGGASVPPEPSREPSTTSGERARAGAREELPEDFPAELRPHLVAVYRVLRDVARRTRNGKEVKPYALARVVMTRPRKPLVQAAHDFAAWADGRGYPRRDVVAAYRNWLDRTEDLAARERLPGEEGDGSASVPANVTPIRPRGGGKPPKSWEGALRRLAEEGS